MPYQLIMGQNLNLAHKRFLRQIKRIMSRPDEMKDGSKKPTYVQVTDKRGTLAGWKLTLSQPEQFKTATGEELVGAQLTFTKAEGCLNGG